MVGKRVLVIEDDAELLQLMSIAFDAAGYEVKSAPDGQQGLTLFENWPADLVVTDMVMPIRDGIETIVALKETRQPVKIIAISGGFRVGPEDYLTLARHLGADDTLAKPFSLTSLVSAADQLMVSHDRTIPSVVRRRPGEPSYELTERLDDAVMLARLLLAKLQAPEDDFEDE
jgi:DNA-binding response OmpR family regulator